MNASRIATLTAITLLFYAGLATAQVADPAVPPAPAAELPAPTAPSSVPVVPAPPELPASPLPGVPGLPATIPGMAPAGAEPGGLPSAAAGAAGTLGLPAAQPAVQESDNALLRLFDTDGNGRLSGDEVNAAPARLWELDRNLNAELSADELGLVMAPRWSERRRAVPGRLPVEPPQVQPPLAAVPEPPVSNERPNFQVYPLRGLDPSRTLAALQQLVQDQPEARLTFDGRTRSILVLALPGTHARIRETLASLLEGERTGVPGLASGAPPAAMGAEIPVVPRVVPLYNAGSAEILRIIQQVYRDRIVEPGAVPPPAASQIPGVQPPPLMGAPTVPAGKMVVGEGADPDTIVVSAEDPLFFEVVDLIERLDESREPAAPGAGNVEVVPSPR